MHNYVLIKFYPKFYPKSFRLYRHFYTQKQKKVKLKANRLNGLQSTTFMEIFLWFNQCPGNSEIPGKFQDSLSNDEMNEPLMLPSDFMTCMFVF